MIAYSDGISVAANYEMKVRSRPLFVSQYMREFLGEVFDALIYAAYVDTKGMQVELRSDDVRHVEQAPDVDSTQVYEGSATTVNANKFRRTIEVVPQEGFKGTYFTVEIRKIIADTGAFAYWGSDLNVIPRGIFTPEFTTPMAAMTAGY
jgi:hypothetical protein